MGRLGVIDDSELNVQAIQGSTFKFSATKVDKLGASEYTLVTIVVDGSSSVERFWDSIRQGLLQVLEACSSDKNPRADNLMVRLVVFSTTATEVHGFIPVRDVNPDLYRALPCPGGVTALWDACYNSVQAMVQYGNELVGQQFSVNSALFVITDGEEYGGRSTATTRMIREAIERARSSEAMESLLSVLVGVNTDASTGLNAYLDSFRRETGFTQYVSIGDANPAALMKLAKFVSASISSQSKALGSGGPSQALGFN